MMFPTAACWWRSPKWRCPRVSAASIGLKPACLWTRSPSGSAKTNRHRYVIAAPFAEADKIVQEARALYIPVAELGKTGGDAITLEDKDSVQVGGVLRRGFENWFSTYMSGEEILVYQLIRCPHGNSQRNRGLYRKAAFPDAEIQMKDLGG